MQILECSMDFLADTIPKFIPEYLITFKSPGPVIVDNLEREKSNLNLKNKGTSGSFRFRIPKKDNYKMIRHIIPKPK